MKGLCKKKERNQQICINKTEKGWEVTEGKKSFLNTDKKMNGQKE